MVKKLYSYLKEHKHIAFLCAFLTSLEVLCELFLPYLMSRIVDVGIAEQNLAYIAKIGLTMIFLAASAICIGVFNAKNSAKVSQIFAANIRKDMFFKIQNYSFANIDNFSSSSLITRLTSDVNIMQMTFMLSLRLLIRAPLMLIFAYIVALSINARLSLVILAAVVALVSIIAFILPKAGKLFATVQKRIDNLNGAVQENLIAIRVVKAFVRKDYEKEKFTKANDELMEAAIRAGSLVAMFMPFMVLVLNIGIVSIMWFGGNFVGQGTMAAGELISFVNYIMQILMAVMLFTMIFVMITRAKACAQRVLEVVDTKSDILDEVPNNKAVITKGKIEFKNVNFKYAKNGNLESSQNGGEYVLSNINITIEPGEFVGIIGGTGSGKSSLISLIPRFYDVSEGEVLIDGVNVKGYTQSNLRDGIGLVMQKNNLFTGTIKKNIAWGKEDASIEEIVKVAKFAQAHNFIESFSEGYDTELGQGGVNLSGGQKQRVCIARAMLKNSPILIFDDSTSAVDTKTEALIRESFYNDFKDSTIILVAQRISSVKDADKVIVLDDGKIVDIGNHDKLMETCEIYREIYTSQIEGSVMNE